MKNGFEKNTQAYNEARIGEQPLSDTERKELKINYLEVSDFIKNRIEMSISERRAQIEMMQKLPGLYSEKEMQEIEDDYRALRKKRDDSIEYKNHLIEKLGPEQFNEIENEEIQKLRNELNELQSRFISQTISGTPDQKESMNDVKDRMVDLMTEIKIRDEERKQKFHSDVVSPEKIQSNEEELVVGIPEQNSEAVVGAKSVEKTQASKQEIQYKKVIGGKNEEERKNVMRKLEDLAKYPRFNKEMRAHEVSSTEKEREAISNIEYSVDEMVKNWGGDPVHVKRKKILLVEKGAVKKITNRKFDGGVTRIIPQEMFVERNASLAAFAVTVGHELFHLKSYKSAQVDAKGELKPYRSGVGVFERAEGNKKYFGEIEEAIVAESAHILYHEKMRTNPLFKEDIEKMDVIRSWVKRISEFHKSKNDFSKELLSIPDIDTHIAYLNDQTKNDEEKLGYLHGALTKYSKKNQLETFGRERERARLDEYFQKIVDRSNGEFKNKREVFDVFAKANFSGNLFSLAHMIERILGPGSFRELAEDSAYGSSEKEKQKNEPPGKIKSPDQQNQTPTQNQTNTMSPEQPQKSNKIEPKKSVDSVKKPDGKVEKLSPEEAKGLKAAEVLLGKEGITLALSNFDAKEKTRTAHYFDRNVREFSSDDKKRILEKLKTKFSSDAIEKAAELSDFRMEYVKQCSEIKRDNKAGENKEGERGDFLGESGRSYDRLKLNNAFKGKLEGLAGQLYKDELARLKKEYEGIGEEQLNQIIKEKMFGGAYTREWSNKEDEYKGGNFATGFTGTGEQGKKKEFDSYNQFVTKVVGLEIERTQEMLEMAEDRESSKNSLFRKTLSYWTRLPRSARIALSGVTGFVATGGLALPVTAAAGYLAFRFGRSAISSVLAMGAQKYVTENVNKFVINPLENMAIRKVREDVYSKDNIATNEAEFDEAILSENFELVTKCNVTRGFELEEETRGRTKWVKRIAKGIKGGAAITTGLLVGGLAAHEYDTILGAGPVPVIVGGGSKDIPVKGGTSPETHVPSAPSRAAELVTAKKGDSVWKILEHDAEKNVKGFNELNEAQKTYFIDHLKDEVVANPHKFGLENADQIQTGYGKELGSLFSDQTDIDKTLDIAKHLSKGQMASILESNAEQHAHLAEHATGGVKEYTMDEVVVTGTGVPGVHVDPTMGKTLAENAADAKISTHIPDSFMGNKSLAQNYLNYKGNPAFEEGSTAYEAAKQQGREFLSEYAAKHPDLMHTNPDFRNVMRGVYAENITKELGEGGAFKFLDSADHEDLFRETTNLGRAYGLTHDSARLFSDYVAQGHEMNEATFQPFINPDSGEFLQSNFESMVKQFGSLLKQNTLPEIPKGHIDSVWEPRVIDVMGKSELGLVHQSAPDVFEYKILDKGDIVSNLSRAEMESHIFVPKK